MNQIIVKITSTRKTSRFPESTACENSESIRVMTENGFKVETTSLDGRYQYDFICIYLHKLFEIKKTAVFILHSYRIDIIQISSYCFF